MTATLRLRILAACAVLVGLAFIQDPGFLVADTKFDLVMDPTDFLARALHLWDGEGAFGQLQNQAYGYLWPMGPFFVAGSAAAIPGWVVQRLWLSLVLVVAFGGSARLARALGVRSDFACILAGFAFTLSPRMLTTLGPISIEAWPSAMAPWVLLPLVLGSATGSPRRAAALSGLAVAMVGGVNAAATFAVIPIGAVWLLTRSPGPRRRSLMLWWPAFTLLGTLWWLVPLFVMGAYSPPFLDFIETTGITTFPTTIFDALRGTSDWVPYVDSGSRAGNDLLRTSYLALNSGVVLLLGFAGLLDRRTPHRRFLAFAVLIGVLMVTAGHQGSVHGWFAGGEAGLLDGVLSPLRNVHKFDVVLRLPLVLGLAFALDRVLRTETTESPASVAGGPALWKPPALSAINKAAFVGMAVVAVAGAALPAIQGRLYPQGATVAVPGYWEETADWLAAQPGDGTALLIPGSGFGGYVWGNTRDEPLQFLADSRWAVRNAIPLAPPGNIRMLDGIEDRLAQGKGSVGLTEAFRRAGVQFLVVRNDLSRSGDTPDPVLVHQALARSPGLELATSFGPDVGGEGHLVQGDERVLVNGGWQAVYAAVEVYEVPRTAPAVSSSSLPVVVGGPEDIPDLADLDAIGDGPVVLATDVPPGFAPQSELVLTDGLRARERSFARGHDGSSEVLSPGDVGRLANPTRDYLMPSADRWSTTAAYRGLADLSASSSGSDAGEAGGARRGELPYAALDGAMATQWVSGQGRDERAWWQADLPEAQSVNWVRITGGSEAASNQSVRVRTDHAVSDPIDLGPGQTRAVRLDTSATRTLRIEDVHDPSPIPLALAEVRAPGLDVDRSLVLPELPQAWGTPDRIVLRADADARTGCVEIGGDVRCFPGRAQASEESSVLDRTVILNGPASFDGSLVVRPRPGRPLLRRLLQDQPLDVATSSVGAPDVRASGYAALDGDPGTAWIASTDDARPTISVSWLGEREVSGFSMSVDEDTAARLPEEVTLTWPGGTRTVTVDAGRAAFAPITTERLRIEIEEAEPAVSLGFDAQPSDVPIGIGELRLTGVPFAPLGLSLDPVTFRCGQGPDVTVNSFRFQTQVTAVPAELGAGRPASATLCLSGTAGAPRVALREGSNVVRTRPGSGFTVQSLVLSGSAGAVAATSVPSGIAPAGPVTRTVTAAPGAAVVAMRENTNPGWRATSGDAKLEPVTLDGWQQGWLVPESASAQRVDVRFAPDVTYRAGLFAGMVSLLLLFGACLLVGRRAAGDSPPLEERRVSALLGIALLAAGLGLLAGWPGLLAGGVAFVAVRILSRRAADLTPLLLGLLCLVAATDYAVTPWGSQRGWAGSDSWPHYLMLVPLAAAVLSAVGTPVSDSPRRGRQPSSRMFFRPRAGRSTSR